MKPKHVLVHRAKHGHHGLAPRRTMGPRPAATRPGQVRVGLWDLGAWLGNVHPRLIQRFNQAQQTLVFYEVVATVPVGLTSSPQRVASWFAEDVMEDLTDDDRQHLAENVIANEFFTAAESVRIDLGVDYLVGVTPSMVAGVDEEGAYWNYFSTFNERVVLASTCDLRVFAKKSRIPFEVFLGGIIVAQTLVAMFPKTLDFHDDRGCLFDYHENRESISKSVANVVIEKDCLRRIEPRYRTPAKALLDAIKSVADKT